MGKSKNHPQGVTWPQAARDVLTASMTKGQLPLVIVGCILLSLIWRMSESKVDSTVDALLDGLNHFWLMGYLFFLCALLGWYFHLKHQRRLFTTEMNRVTDERNKLQEHKLGNRLQSSDRR